MIKVYGADVEYLKFNAGEPHVKVTNLDKLTVQTIVWKFENIEEFFYLALIVDVMRNHDKWVNLYIPYFPFARQDRATTESQPFSLDVFCKMIATLDLRSLTVNDFHSEAGFRTLRNACSFSVFQESQRDCYLDVMYFENQRYDCVIAPDKGAVDKAEEIAKLEKTNLITATKTRDSLTGALSNPQIDFGDLEVKSAIIVDDILDYGGTFVQLAKAIKEQKPEIKLDLYVTHGLFGGGIEKYKGLFNNIYCYNIMNKELKVSDLIGL